MGYDQQQPVPLGRAGSFPPGATPPTVAWIEHPNLDAVGPAESAGAQAGKRVPEPAVNWPGRRSLSTTERVRVCLIAGAIAGYLVLLTGVAPDWGEHSVTATITAVLGVVGVVAVVSSAWARRPDQPRLQGSPLRRLPRATGRALLRELRAGRPGPPELRADAIAWTCWTLQAPWTPGLYLLLVANGAAGLSRGGTNPLWMSALFAVLSAAAILAAGVDLGRRRAAHQVADTLDQLIPRPPRRSEPA